MDDHHRTDTVVQVAYIPIVCFVGKDMAANTMQEYHKPKILITYQMNGPSTSTYTSKRDLLETKPYHLLVINYLQQKRNMFTFIIYFNLSRCVTLYEVKESLSAFNYFLVS